MTRLFLPAALFVVSAFMSVMSLHSAWVSAVVGLCLCVYSVIRRRRAVAAGASDQTGLAASAAMRAGAALLAAPAITVLLVVAAMSGLFARN